MYVHNHKSGVMTEFILDREGRLKFVKMNEI